MVAYHSQKIITSEKYQDIYLEIRIGNNVKDKSIFE